MEEREFKTTFFEDFTIADKFWEKAIKDTYKNAFDGWKTNVKYFTEFVVALNRKIWERYEKDDKLARLYNDLWQEADAYACDYFKWDDATYFFEQTD